MHYRSMIKPNLLKWDRKLGAGLGCKSNFRSNAESTLLYVYICLIST